MVHGQKFFRITVLDLPSAIETEELSFCLTKIYKLGFRKLKLPFFKRHHQEVQRQPTQK